MDLNRPVGVLLVRTCATGLLLLRGFGRPPPVLSSPELSISPSNTLITGGTKLAADYGIDGLTGI